MGVWDFRVHGRLNRLPESVDRESALFKIVRMAIHEVEIGGEGLQSIETARSLLERHLPADEKKRKAIMKEAEVLLRSVYPDDYWKDLAQKKWQARRPKEERERAAATARSERQLDMEFQDKIGNDE